MVDQDTSRIETIVRVAGDVRPPINDQRRFAQDSGKPFCQHRSGKSCAYNQ